MSDDAHAVSPGTRLGPYEIVAPVGAGGMGEVYRARDPRLARDVAVKVLSESLARDPQALSRFEREAKAVAALAHPNILAIHDVGTHDGVAYTVTELLEGETLRSRLEVSALPWREAVQIAMGIAKGLAAAHSRGIVHRDIKPENLFLTSDGRVKILDFGVARVTAAASDGETSLVTQTEAGAVVGTAGYMSPEQVRGAAVDAASDIFSLGCVIYEMIAGRRAFVRDTPAQTMTAILEAEPPPLGDCWKADSTRTRPRPEAMPGKTAGGALSVVTGSRICARRHAPDGHRTFASTSHRQQAMLWILHSHSSPQRLAPVYGPSTGRSGHKPVPRHAHVDCGAPADKSRQEIPNRTTLPRE